jgi:hypothetical protein
MGYQRFSEEQRKLAIKLRDGGIPLKVPEAEWAHDLIITQQGSLIESTAFDLSNGRTGFVVHLHILFNKSNLALASFDLEVPWRDSSIHWLEDPKTLGVAGGSYRFPGTFLEFPRADVINHVADRCKMRRKGKPVAGLLLGVGSVSMPSERAHGTDIPAFVNATDQFGHVFSFDISLWANRSEAEGSNRSRTRTRRRLVESRVPVPR